MTDPNAVATAVGMLNAALSAFKNVRDLSAGSSDLSLKESLAELHDKLIYAKQSLMELADENRDLKQQLEAKAELERRAPFGYWYKKGESDPLCPLCYQRDGKLVYLDKLERTENGYVKRACIVCQQPFYEQSPRGGF
jgi:hypothetical protein